MAPRRPTSTRHRTDEEPTRALRRRRFIALGGGLGATLLAGCSAAPEAGTPDAGTSGSTGGGGGAGTMDGRAGTFRLLISDQPVAIDDFDSLEVTFDSARIFRGDGADEAGETATPPSTANATATVTTTEETGTPSATEAEDGDDDGEGFFVLDLDGATVDLTTVVGDKAIGVFEGELEEGRYTKIELFASDVAGVVGGEAVDVKIPSGKLQITKPFEVEAGQTVSFVFDINVVQRGPRNGYNLLPVIGESGVAGDDVEVDEVEPGDDEEDGSGNGSEAGTGNDSRPEEAGSGQGGGPPAS